MLKRSLSYLRSNRIKIKKARKKVIRWGLALFLIWYIFCLPTRLFNDSTSTVLLDREGNLLGARIAGDGQWRFPESERVPGKIAVCMTEFEDRNFYSHIGISLKGIGRAITQNMKHKKVVSGGSTITMQLARIMRKNPPRTYTEKVIEMLLATRMEIRYSKKEILQLYASHAPFGNNVVGLEAASWRYFGRRPYKLSWAESATLAVLPNAPGLIYPGKNHTRLQQKRDQLLKRLYEIHKIDLVTYQLAIAEPLPEKPLPLPQFAPHLLDRFIREGKKGETIISTLHVSMQEKAMQILNIHSLALQDNQVMNGAVMITAVNTGEVVAYVGNTNTSDAANSSHVDCINAPRSTGSILKPLLYAKSLEAGIITPSMLVTDIPSQFGSFSPKNFTGMFDGAVPVNKALSRSLNIPMVHLLNQYGLSRFHADLKQYGLTTINKPARHYGLSLILGGAEAKLCDLSAAYTQMAQELKFGKRKPILFTRNNTHTSDLSRTPLLTDRACIYSTFEAMVDVNRPDEDNNWRMFSSSRKIAWKTGTSFGFRDAWAIGITPDYVVSVWIGNADGEGRPGLTGVNSAAPLLFDIFRQLPNLEPWFKQPWSEMASVKICHESGHRASDICEKTDQAWIPKTCLNTIVCTYHQIVHLSADGQYRVDSDCESVYNMQHQKWFVLPSVIERYYKFNHPNYRLLPEYKPECLSRISDRSMALLYPKAGSRIYVPVEINEETGRTIFEAAHRNAGTKIYWHLDDQFIGETKDIHQLALNPPMGKHKLTLVDENGVSVSVNIEILGKKS